MLTRERMFCFWPAGSQFNIEDINQSGINILTSNTSSFDKWLLCTILVFSSCARIVLPTSGQCWQKSFAASWNQVMSTHWHQTLLLWQDWQTAAATAPLLSSLPHPAVLTKQATQPAAMHNICLCKHFACWTVLHFAQLYKMRVVLIRSLCS